MNENSLRMRGRIGGMKGVCAIVMILALILAGVGAINLNVALKNSSGAPREVSLSELISAPVTSQYVTTSG